MDLSFQPSDAAYSARIHDSFRRQNFMQLIGASLGEVAPGRVEVILPFRAELTQQHGFFHGGVTSTIADNAGGYAAFSLFPADSSVLTVEFKINLLAPAQGERLIAVGQVLKTGRTLAVCDLKVFAVEGERRTLCAAGLQTMMCLQGKSDG